MFGTVDRTNKRGRTCREWMDDIVSWCKTELQKLNSSPKITEDRNSSQDKQWTPMGAGPMVPEEEEGMLCRMTGENARTVF